MSQNYPNPFNIITKIEIAIPFAAHIKVQVYNILEQNVYIKSEFADAGYYTFTRDSKNFVNEVMPCGL